MRSGRADTREWAGLIVPHVANSRPLWYPWWQEAIMRKFQVVAPYQPSGDQPQAIERLAEGFLR
ncbi:MAG: hypothetical protein IJ441_03450, partial [Spirochaetaceae bacterium]|nr:hypothetical protein [Spirochaetaceae bacterium]